MLGKIGTVFVFADGVAHDADELRAELLHARDGPVDLGFSDGKVVGDLLGPVANERAEAADLHVLFGETLADLVEHGFGDLVEIALHAIELDHAGLDAVPAEFLVNLDLDVE